MIIHDGKSGTWLPCSGLSLVHSLTLYSTRSLQPILPDADKATIIDAEVIHPSVEIGIGGELRATDPILCGDAELGWSDVYGYCCLPAGHRRKSFP